MLAKNCTDMSVYINMRCGCALTHPEDLLALSLVRPNAKHPEDRISEYYIGSSQNMLLDNFWCLQGY